MGSSTLLLSVAFSYGFLKYPLAFFNTDDYYINNAVIVNRIRREVLALTTREKLRKAALALFVKKGVKKTTIGEIESRAGLAPRAGGFYRHFSSKDELVAEIAAKDVVETPEELNLSSLFPLGDTRAELMLLGRSYLTANKRQRPLAKLINETRFDPKIKKIVQSSNKNLVEVLCQWISTKPRAAGLDSVGLHILTMTVFGGWLFYLTKRTEGIDFPELDDETMLVGWAQFWGKTLDEN